MNARLSLLVDSAPRRRNNDESVEEQHEIFVEILVVATKVVMERMEISKRNEERVYAKKHCLSAFVEMNCFVLNHLSFPRDF